MAPSAVDYQAASSALAQFDPADLFEALSTGIILLDEQLCAIYANRVAQKVMQFTLGTARGRPFMEVVGNPLDLATVLLEILKSEEYAAWRDGALEPTRLQCAIGPLTVTTSIMVGQATGLHFLLEIGETPKHQARGRSE